MTNKEKIIKVLEKALEEISDYEDKCFAKMAFCNEHKMDMEREAIRYKQEAFNKSKLILWNAIDKVKAMER